MDRGEYRYDEGQSLTVTGWMLLDKGTQELTGSYLQQYVVALLQQVTGPLGKADRLAHLARPVGGIRRLLVRNPCPCYTRNVWYLWLAKHKATYQLRHRS